MLNASAFAASIGMPLNVTITIHWGSLRIASVHSALQRMRLFISRLGKWLSRLGLPLVYVWVQEVSPGTGLHAHVLLSVGATTSELVAAELSRRTAGFLVGADSELPPEGAVLVSCSRYTPTRIARTGKQLRGLIAYLLKGANAKTAAEIGIRAQPRKTGKVQGRRVGVAHSIGPTARAAAGWREHPLQEFDLGFVKQGGPPRPNRPCRASRSPPAHERPRPVDRGVEEGPRLRGDRRVQSDPPVWA